MSRFPKKHSDNIAKRHHYIPQLYLAGFTDSGKKDGLLYAHDFRQRKTWPGKPETVGFENNFYKIDVPGVRADEVEKVFWEIEGAAAKVLKKIIQKKKLPGRRRKNYNVLMRFLAQLVVRRPSARESLTNSIEQVLRMVGSMYAGLPDKQLRAHLDRLREQHNELAETDLDAFCEFVRSDEYTIEFSQNFHVENLLNVLLPTGDTLAPILGARNWVLFVADGSAGLFITSDRPVVLSWTVEVPPFYAANPGFGLENTVVVVPLSKNLALYGRFHGPSGKVIPADADTIALINRMVSYGVVRFVYSTDESFSWKKSDGSIGDTEDLYDAIAEHQAKKKEAAEQNEILASAEVSSDQHAAMVEPSDVASD